MLFQRELNEQQQRQLALRLRHIELRAELAAAHRDLLQPLQLVQGLMGSVPRARAGLWGGLGLAAAALAWHFRGAKSGAGSLGATLNWLRLGLRVARLWTAVKAEFRADFRPEAAADGRGQGRGVRPAASEAEL